VDLLAPVDGAFLKLTAARAQVDADDPDASWVDAQAARV
jgi:hypothetical protein